MYSGSILQPRGRAALHGTMATISHRVSMPMTRTLRHRLPLFISLSKKMHILNTCMQSKRVRHAIAMAATHDDVGTGVLRFRVKKAVNFGEHVRLVGNSSYLGRWNPTDSKATMSWTDGDVWEWTCPVAEMHGSVEFKCVVVQDGGEVDWEGGENHVLDGSKFVIEDGGDVTVKWSRSVEVDAPQRFVISESGEWEQSRDVSIDSFDKPELEQWSGNDTVFMQSNEHPRERQGQWKTDGLDGVALKIVQGDREAGNWLSKLELAKNTIVDRSCNMRPPLETLAHAFIYLTWVSNGSISCVESGGHHRPNHHARLSQLIFRSLEWIIGERPGTPDALLARRMQTRIPSFTDEFMQSTPLTRIRDIAHRNDIPQDLKREIKHTIQNKLHRNAGPEDLAASESLLKRIMQDKDHYSQDFVRELEIFLKELRDFFNAGSLEDALADMAPSLDDDSNRIIDSFIIAKRKFDAMESWDDNVVMDCMHALTTVRALLSHGLSGGLRNDAPEKALSMRQKWRLAEIRAEDYLFVLLSRFINTVEDKGGSDYLEQGSDGAWALPIGALVLSLRHIGITGYMQSECMALENELTTWQQMGGFGLQDEARRFSAALNRVLSLTESFCSVVIESLYSPAVTLGSSLGVETEKATVFSESEIRSNMAFQTAKLATLMLKAARKAANMPPWQVIRQGECSGVLVEVDELSPRSISEVNVKGNFIAVVKNATGDEELVSLSKNLQGVVLLHEIPHLSHLGVRARQEKMTFIASDDKSAQKLVLDHLGNPVTICAGGDGISLQFGENVSSSVQENRQGVSFSNASKVALVDHACVLPLSEARVETSGAKASACNDLLSLAKECLDVSTQRSNSNGSNAFFHALDGLVVPFGCLESVISQNGQKDVWDNMLDRAHTFLSATANHPEELDALCEELQEFVMSQKIPGTISVMIESSFKNDPMLILRSSANVEDLEGLSGAGLYDSITNVPRDNLEAIDNAIKSVWASLFSRRAMLARAAVGIHPRDAFMAVLIQPQLAPELSFVLHTKHPLVEDSLLAEIAPGQGETLASGTRGSGWRFTVGAESISCDSFANFSEVLLPQANSKSLVCKTMDYSRHELSCSVDAREMLGKRLAVVGKLLEKVFASPQDVEGCIVNEQMYILQTRPQP